MPYTLTTLDNGFRIATEARPHTHSVAFALAVNVGARHETLEEAGLSHMLEHMAFKGTSRLNAREIAEAFDRMGGNVNAYTSHEHTVYYAKVLKEYAPEALTLLCEIVTDSVFDAGELEREREVILQEIAMHHDAPDDLVFDLFQETSFPNQPLGRPILGTPERVAAYRRDDLLAYVAKHYHPARMTLAAAGAIAAEQVEAIAKGFFASPTQAPTITLTQGTLGGGEKLMEKDLEQVQLVLGFAGYPVTHPEYYALQIFATILGGGMSSRLFQEIREQRGLAYSVSAFATGYQDVGSLGVYAGTTAEHLPELMHALKEILSGVSKTMTEAELRRAKNQIKAGVVMSDENNGTVAEWIARHLHVYGRYKTPREIADAIEAITLADVILAGDYALATPTPTLAALGPEGSVLGKGLWAQWRQS